MKAYNVIARTVVTIRDNLIYACISLPLRTFSICLEAQLLLLRIPLNIVHMLTRKFQWPSKTQRLQSVLGCNKDDTAAVLNAMKEIRITSMNAVSKMSTFNCEFEKHRKRFDEWKREIERETNQLFVIASEEKLLMKVIVGALKHLRKLKSTRETMDQKLNNYTVELVALSRDGCNQSIDTKGERNESLKNCFNILRQEAEQMKSEIESKVPANNFQVAETNIFTSPPKPSLTPKLNIHNSPLLNLTMETFQSVLSLLMVENVQLKRKLSVTSNRLEEVGNVLKILSEEIVSLSQTFGEIVRLNNKIFDLQSDLKKAKEMLRTSEDDRDLMRRKLLTLRGMIEEQEDYLNYDDKDYLDEDNFQEDSLFSGFVICDCDTDSTSLPADCVQCKSTSTQINLRKTRSGTKDLV